jgi:hypothetical protein
MYHVIVIAKKKLVLFISIFTLLSFIFCILNLYSNRYLLFMQGVSRVIMSRTELKMQPTIHLQS